MWVEGGSHMLGILGCPGGTWYHSRIRKCAGGTVYIYMGMIWGCDTEMSSFSKKILDMDFSFVKEILRSGSYFSETCKKL